MTVQPSPAAPTTALWQRVPPAGRDRVSQLTAEQIAHAAFAIADAENLQGVSVKRVANRLRVPSARLEQYLPHREDLFDLMLDVGLGEIVLPDADAGDWQAGLEQLARGLYAVARAHPWLVEVIGARAPSGPHGLRLVERALQLLGAAGPDVRTCALSFNALLSYVCGSVRVETRQHPFKRAGGRAASDARYLADAVSTGAYPMLADLFAADASITDDQSFELGLNALLDGIAGRVAAGTATGVGHDGGPG